MKKTIKLFLVIVTLSVFCQTLLMGDVRCQIDFSSRYIWRGFDLNPYKKPVLQPSVDWKLGKSGIALNLWSSLSFASRELNEFDLTLSYRIDLTEDFSMEAGLIHYAWYFTENFEFKDDTSHEVFLSFCLNTLLFEPVLSIYYDFTVGDGIYLQLDIGQSFPILNNLDMALSSSLGYNGGQWLAEGTAPGFSDLNFRLAFPFTTGRFHAVVFASYTIVLLEAIGQDSHFWFGISAGYRIKGGPE